MKLQSLISAITARSSSTRIAIDSSDRSWSYAQLNQCYQDLRHGLKKHNLDPGSRVAVVASSSHETIALIIAVASLGHTPLLMSPRMGANVRETIYVNNHISTELSANPQSHKIRTLPGRENRRGIAVNPPAAALLTTSGTTGTPKVVNISAGGLQNFLTWAIKHFALGRGSRVVSYAPFNFDLSLLEVWATLASGATILLTNPDKATDPAHVGELVFGRSPSLIQAVPMFYQLLAEYADQHQLAPAAKGPDHLISTGDATSQTLRKRLSVLFPTSIFHNIYGSTETNNSFIYSCSAASFAHHDTLPIGQPIDEVHYRILDKDDHSTHSQVSEGLLYTSTPFMSSGYTDTQLNLDSFVQLTADGRTYFRTGDTVRLNEEGELLLLGREDFIVKVRGVRTNLLDIEAVLSRYPGVIQAIAIHQDDEATGKTLHALLHVEPDQPFDALDIRSFCASRLPHTAIPRTFRKTNEKLPTTSTGKPDRNAITSLFSTRKKNAPH